MRGGRWWLAVAALVLVAGCLATPAAAQERPQLGPPAPGSVTTPSPDPNAPAEPTEPAEPEPEPEPEPLPEPEPEPTPAEPPIVAPTPASGQLSAGQLRLRAQQLDADHATGEVEARGNVELTYNELTLNADRLRANLKDRTVSLDGLADLGSTTGVTMNAEGLSGTLGDRQFKTGRFSMIVPAAVAGYGIAEPIRIDGASAEAHPDVWYLGREIIASGCPPNDRKYYLRAREIELYPNRSLTLRGARAVLFGVPIFGIGKLTIPLRPYRRMEHLPDFGRDDIYGFWGRYRYAYDLAESQDGDLMAMLTEKRGMIFGLTHNYGFGSNNWKGGGRVEANYGTKAGELTLRGDLNQGLGQQLRLIANVNHSRHSGFSTASEQSNLTAALNHTTPHTTTGLNYSHTDGWSGDYHSWYQRASLQQTARVGSLFSADLSTDYNRRGYTGQQLGEEIDTRFRLGGQWRLFDWELLDQRHFDLVEPDSGYTRNSEIVPQLTLTTDSRRLRPIGWWPAPEAFDVRFVTSVGQYREAPLATYGSPTPDTQPDPVTTLRVNFDLNGQLSPIKLGSRARFSADARYSQSFFDHPNPSAKYIMGFSPSFFFQPLPHTRLDLRYRWQEVAGYSPLPRFDFAQEINDVDVSFSWFLPDAVRPRTGRLALRLDGGYDLLYGRWRDISLGLRAAPFDELFIDLSSSYILDAGGWGKTGLRGVRAQLTYDGGRRYRHELGFNWDAQSGLIGPINSLLRLELLPRVSLQNALTYDGYQKKISYNDTMLVYDMGCVSLSGSYRQQTNEWRLDLNLAAFQGLGNLFGTGRYGQTFSTSMGVMY